MKQWRAALAAVMCAGLMTAPASAIPGQTAAQCLAWGKANHNFSKFLRANNDEVGGVGYEMYGEITIAAHYAALEAKPDKRGIIQMEEVYFIGAPTDIHLNDPAVFAQAVSRIYGPAFASDYQSAQRVENTRDVVIWRGKRIGYIALSDVMYTVPLGRIDAMVNNARICDALDCSNGP